MPVEQGSVWKLKKCAQSVAIFKHCWSCMHMVNIHSNHKSSVFLWQTKLLINITNLSQSAAVFLWQTKLLINITNLSQSACFYTCFSHHCITYEAVSTLLHFTSALDCPIGLRALAEVLLVPAVGDVRLGAAGALETAKVTNLSDERWAWAVEFVFISHFQQHVQKLLLYQTAVNTY